MIVMLVKEGGTVLYYTVTFDLCHCLGARVDRTISWNRQSFFFSRPLFISVVRRRSVDLAGGIDSNGLRGGRILKVCYGNN